MNKKITYTTDVAHCIGHECPKKDKCYRYWLYQNDKTKFSSISFVPYTEEQYNFETEQCEMFKPIGP